MAAGVTTGGVCVCYTMHEDEELLLLLLLLLLLRVRAVNERDNRWIFRTVDNGNPKTEISCSRRRWAGAMHRLRASFCNRAK